MTTNKHLAVEPLLLDVCQVASMLNVSRATVFNMLQTGVFAPLPIKLGRRSLWRKDIIEKWISEDCPHRKQWLLMGGKQ